MRRAKLGTRLIGWLATYLLLLSAAVGISGYAVHEHAEHVVWKALLNSELDNLLSRTTREPGFHWQDSDTLSLYMLGENRQAPPSLQVLAPGMHDDFVVAGKSSVVMVRNTRQLGRVALVLDITDFEALERFVSRWTLIGGLAALLVTLAMAIVGMARVLRPITRLADRIGALRPEESQQRIDIEAGASSELHVIAGAVNDYLDRNARFVERERTFIDSASHELRTPIAVIGGAAELALAQADLPSSASEQLQRIARTTAEVEQLISLLLVLAKDPARLAVVSDDVALDQLLPDIVEDHRHLTGGKNLSITVSQLSPCRVVAPVLIVQAAVGNLLRNAIEHSDRGDINIALHADATVVISDPGHGMSPEEISAIYAQLARGGGRHGGGIGLDLISRLCEHLGWTLQFSSDPGHGTVTTLRFQPGAAR